MSLFQLKGEICRIVTQEHSPGWTGCYGAKSKRYTKELLLHQVGGEWEQKTGRN